MKSNFRSLRNKAVILVTGLVLLFSMVGVSLKASAAGTGPCDIYASAGNPCVAAHSTVRALYGAYNGRLYQIRRANGNTLDINTLSAGGFANAAAQDSFCAGTTCVLTAIYDQSGHGNDMWYQGSTQVPGSSVSIPANANKESLTVSGNKVYALNTDPHVSYWRDGHTTGIPTGTQPEGMYMVTSGTHYNSGCCFDYGNSETTRTADAAGAMDAIYFGSSCWFGGCSGTGPWVQADLEWGLFPGGSSSWNPNQRAFTNKYVTAMLKNNGTTLFAIKGANAQSGSLTTLYSGTLPSGYNPMKKQGAIVLGSGGDCCKPGGGANDSAGTFYEGAMVTGYPSDATDNAVQANIVAAGYGGTSSGPTPTPGGPTPTPNGSFPVAGTYYRLINRNSGKVAEVAGFSTADGGNVQQWSSTGTSSQQWRFVSVGGGYYNVINRGSGKCLDVTGVSTTNGANVQQWTCGSGTNQRWQLVAVGSYYQLKVQHSGQVLDVVGNGTADGVNIDQWPSNGGNNQQWQIVP